jgi:hypothetical protein
MITLLDVAEQNATKPVSFRADPTLLAEFNEVREREPYKPSFTQAMVKAMEEYIAARKPAPAKPKRPKPK